jgi:hypothetical protein
MPDVPGIAGIESGFEALVCCARAIPGASDAATSSVARIHLVVAIPSVAKVTVRASRSGCPACRRTSHITHHRACAVEEQ